MSMTNSEKQLLLVDLCGRLPYGVMIQRDNGFAGKVAEKLNAHGLAYDEIYGTFESLNYKPYLRPMSSMTEEEREEFQEYVFDSDEIGNIVMLDASDWLNEHHFDYRGLIPMGLALEAPEGMYKTE